MRGLRTAWLGLCLLFGAAALVARADSIQQTLGAGAYQSVGTSGSVLCLLNTQCIYGASQSITTSSNYNGWFLNNSTNNVVALNGQSAGDDNGALTLNNAGVAKVQIIANGNSFVPNLTMGAGGAVITGNGMALAKNTSGSAAACPSAPSAAFATLYAVPGSTAGTGALIVCFGTSTTPLVVGNNGGAGF